ncbi:glycosyltransferase family 39 protein [Candidatus Woesearchaeota archaeon]|nr:glycosyltransferase family 39 protein [Candidatus Woesearchaeota archaeon]
MKPFKNYDAYTKAAIAIIIAGAALRFTLAALSHPAGDGCWHLSVSRFIAENSRIPFLEPFGITDREVFSAPPLFHTITAAVYRIIGTASVPAAEFAVKLVSPLFGSLTLLIVFLLGKRLYSTKTAFWATFFITFLPLHINSSTVAFVDSLTAFLAALTVYFLVSRKTLTAAAFLGLGIAAKLTMIFMAPIFLMALLAFYRHDLKKFAEKVAASAIISAAIGLPWLLRNYLLLGNPFWPFLYKILGGSMAPQLGESFSAANILSLGNIGRFHLELMGAPLGNLSTAAFVMLPFQNLLIAMWLILTILFLTPAVAGVLAKGLRNKWLVYSWTASFLLATAIYTMNTGTASARIFLPAIPALALLWAAGFEKLSGKAGRFATLLVVMAAASALAFSAVETAKTTTGAKEWARYNDDFNWIKDNTPENTLMAYRGQCLGYNVHRPSNFNLGKADYVWVNQGFRLEPVSIVEPEVLQRIETDFAKAYENSATGTKVYKRKS